MDDKTLKIIDMLQKGMTYLTIQKTLKVSPKKISRINDKYQIRKKAENRSESAEISKDRKRINSHGNNKTTETILEKKDNESVENKQITQEILSLQKKTIHLEEKLRNSENKVIKIQKQNQDLKNCCNALRKSFNEKDHQIALQKQEIEELKYSNLIYQEEYKSYKEKCSELREENHDLKNQFHKKENEIEELNNNFEKIKRQLEDVEDKFKLYKMTHTQLSFE